MKIGIASTCMWSFKPEKLIEFASSYGIYSVELWIDHIQQYNPSYNNLKGYLNNHGIVPTVHSISWDINISSFSKEVREFSIGEVIKSIDIAYELGCRIVVVHPGKMSFTAAGKKPFIKILAESLNRIIEYSKDTGLMICLENIEPLPKELIVYPEDFENLFKLIDSKNIMITMDLAHLGKIELIKKFYNTLKNKIAHIHISDLTSNKIHIPLGKGTLPITEILRTIKNRESIIFNIEFFNNSRDLSGVKNSIDLLRNSEKILSE